MKKALILLVAQLVLLAGSARADVTLPHVFGDHMVLQRDKAVPVWGWAAPNEKITVEFAGQKKSAVTNAEGKWTITLDPMPASAEPRDLTISSSNPNSKIQNPKFSDVLVGEVWLCSGQSNMEFTVGSSNNAQQEIAEANFPQIREIAIPKATASVPNPDVTATWKVCSPQTAGGFTACGYFMARELHKKLNIPIGLLHSSWGGTRIEPWTPPIGFAQVPALESLQKEVTLANPHASDHKDGLGKYLETLEAWIQSARQAIPQEKLLPPQPVFPQEFVPMAARPSPQQQPTTLYNAMIHPLIPYAIRGAIWYQGESNHHEGMLYTEKMKALIAGWRQLWGEGDFPFYFVQIAPYEYGSENPWIMGEFWEAQSAALAIPNSGMVVTTDIGNYKDIHPKNKQEVGRRFSLLALNNVYGQKCVCCGPTFKSMAIEGDKIRVRFDNVGGGLASRDSKPLDWFEIIGKETDWTKADAVIDGDSVVVSAATVKEPAAIRFAWGKSAEPNLMNKEGLPAPAFRNGTVPQVDYLALKVPEAKDYQLVYSLDLAKAGHNITYEVDRHAQLAGSFDRVAYFLELRKSGEPSQWVYVSMDAFTDDLTKIGVPTAASKAKFQTKVNHMNVLSSEKRIVTGNGLNGNIEFWPHNYGPANTAEIPNASNNVYDFGDQPSDPEDGYGSMQVHNYEAKQTLFAFNNWKAGQNADLGIGNSDPKASEQHTLDWTFHGNAHSYSIKQLKVLVHLKK